MGVRDMERFLQQWQMDSRDLRRRMMLSPTRREGEGSDRGMQKRGSKYEPPPLPLESDFCPQRRNGLCGEQLAAVPYLNEPVVLPGFTLTSGDPK